MPVRDNTKGRSCLLKLGLFSLFSENNSSVHVHAGEITHRCAAAGTLRRNALLLRQGTAAQSFCDIAVSVVLLNLRLLQRLLP